MLTPQQQHELDERERRDEMDVDLFRAKIAEFERLHIPAMMITTELAAHLIAETQHLRAILDRIAATALIDHDVAHIDAELIRELRRMVGEE